MSLLCVHVCVQCSLGAGSGSDWHICCAPHTLCTSHYEHGTFTHCLMPLNKIHLSYMCDVRARDEHRIRRQCNAANVCVCGWCLYFARCCLFFEIVLVFALNSWSRRARTPELFMLSNALQPQQITPWRVIHLQCTFHKCKKTSRFHLTTCGMPYSWCSNAIPQRFP